MALESTQPLTEMSTRNLRWGKGWLALKAENFTDMGSLDVSETCGPPRPVIGIALHFTTVHLFSYRNLAIVY
jgi:hypothetical protein